MELHELLRHIRSNVPFIFFDLNGKELFHVSTKENIHVDYYSYEIFDIDIGLSETRNRDSALYITLIK